MSAHPQKFQRLEDLQTLARQLRAQRLEKRLLPGMRRLPAAPVMRAQETPAALFARSVGPVQPLRQRPGARSLPLARPAPQPLPRQRLLERQHVLREAMSDAFDADALLEADESLSFRRPGLGLDVVRRLRAGHWRVQRQLDLHGLRVDGAREALGGFLRQGWQDGVRCVRVIHGKGLGSPGQAPVLRSRVRSWLVQRDEVLAFVQARACDGGSGALLVLLQAARG